MENIPRDQVFLSFSDVGGRLTVKLSWIFLRSGSEGYGCGTVRRLLTGHWDWPLLPDWHSLGILIVRKADTDFLIVRRNT